MQELLKKMNDFVNFLTQKLSECEKKEAELLEKESILNSRESSLLLREKTVTEGESNLATRESIDKQLAEIKERQIQFEKDRDNFFLKSEAEKKELAAIRSKILFDQEAVKNSQEMLNKEWEALKLQKDSYRQEIKF